MPIKLLFSQHKNQQRALYIKDGHAIDADLCWPALQNNDDIYLDQIFWGRVLSVYSTHAYIKLSKNQIGILPTETSFPKLHEGQSVLVQVRREAIPDKGTKNKGPVLSQKIVLAGRYCLYHPFQQKRHVSSKINDPAALKRLQDMFSDKEPITIRESAAQVPYEQILHEVEDLRRTFNEINLQHQRAPSLTPYTALSTSQRWLRDLEVLPDNEIFVDNPILFKVVHNFLETHRPDLLPHIHKVRSNLIEEYGFEEFWDSLSEDVIAVPGGGNVVFDITAAAVVIDVNEGEQDQFESNKSAIPVIIQQLKCRHLGGNIVIDFMGLDSSRELSKSLIDQLKHYAEFYNLPLDIFGWSKLGWLEARLPKRRRPIPARLMMGN
jgi:ribonuclease G